MDAVTDPRSRAVGHVAERLDAVTHAVGGGRKHAAELPAPQDPERGAGQDRATIGTWALCHQHRHRSEVRSDQAVLSALSSSRSTRAVCSAR